MKKQAEINQPKETTCCGNCANFDSKGEVTSCHDDRNTIIKNPKRINWCVYWSETRYNQFAEINEVHKKIQKKLKEK